MLYRSASTRGTSLDGGIALLARVDELFAVQSPLHSARLKDLI